MPRNLPDTSHTAKAMFTEDMKQAHHAKILSALTKLHFGIYTDIAIAAGIEPHAVGRRLNELEADGKVWKPGGKKNTPSGRPAYLYQIVGEPQKVEKEVTYKKGEPTAAEHANEIIRLTQQSLY